MKPPITAADIESVSPARAAELLSISVQRVRDAIPAPLPASNFGGTGANARYRIRLVDLYRWQESLKVTP